MTVATPVAAERQPLQHFRCMWPIVTSTRTLDELAEEAWPDLLAICTRSRVLPAGRPRWCIRRGSDVPGSGGAHEVLLADLPVVAAPRNMDVATRKLDVAA